MSFDWKSLTKKELKHIFKNVCFKIQPRWHQLISVVFAVDNSNSRVLFFHGVGTGKTLCSLFTTQLWKCKKILVVCPNSAFSAWEKGLPLGTDYSYTFLTGTKKERLLKLREKKDVYIINYAGLKVLYCKLIRNEGWKINPSFTDGFDCIIIDEAHRVNNYKSLQTEICYKLSQKAKYVIGMTGTAIDKSMLELFNIYKVVDLGKSLGISYFLYRAAYFYRKVFKLRNGREVPEWKLKDDAKEKILKHVSGNTISFDREECFDLPDMQEIPILVKPTKEFLDLQDKIIKNSFFSIQGTEIDNSKDKAKANWLRELSGGFLYYKKNDQENVYHLKKNPKLEALSDLIKGTTSKILVFYWYIEERKLIEKMLKKNKVKFISIYGGQNLIERKEQIKKFTADSNTQVMIAQSKIAEGYDAFVANIIAFYLPLGSPRMRTQCIGRIYRSGQTRKCLIYDFILENSVDSRIIKDRGKRFSLVDSVRKYMQSYSQEVGEI